MSPSAAPSTMPPSAPLGKFATRRTASALWPWFLATDVVLVTMFAALGRRAHEQSPWGALETAWPFLIGALVGWAIVRAHRQPAVLFPTGVVIWLSTEIIGMLLRTLTGQGTAFAFVFVSLGVLGLFLLGYRLIVLLIGRIRSSR